MLITLEPTPALTLLIKPLLLLELNRLLDKLLFVLFVCESLVTILIPSLPLIARLLFVIVLEELFEELFVVAVELVITLGFSGILSVMLSVMLSVILSVMLCVIGFVNLCLSLSAIRLKRGNVNLIVLMKVLFKSNMVLNRLEAVYYY
ncbi:MAG: hypothetical protein F6J98_24805 [Moorea sp. SIO4G2]|uniref:hypothetical protein n=1 Tax=unclassified Moorena TaxID=2683338 RepID=UPI0013FC27A1|nr:MULTISPECIES: hypothetical protein [unclassified Moorena]NEO15685.1 hypothetical protein [Moorena sp. SIO3E8]NEO63481.1 hypothetical protein [Moorena sp. SIO4G2]NEQ02064.1 hypothetical protein [Moorena sp. SIO3F7]